MSYLLMYYLISPGHMRIFRSKFISIVFIIIICSSKHRGIFLISVNCSSPNKKIRTWTQMENFKYLKIFFHFGKYLHIIVVLKGCVNIFLVLWMELFTFIFRVLKVFWRVDIIYIAYAYFEIRDCLMFNKLNVHMQ